MYTYYHQWQVAYHDWLEVPIYRDKLNLTGLTYDVQVTTIRLSICIAGQDTGALRTGTPASQRRG
jgi:hypothetical protein